MKNKKLESLKKALETERPETWDKIPDIDLYMDQIIAYMERQHIGLTQDDEESLTSAMINNYIKSDVMPRAKGKRYNREHIGYLTAICLLKQVLSVKDVGVLLRSYMEEQSIEEFYNRYTELIDSDYTKAAEEIDLSADKKERLDLAMKLAVSAYCDKLLCKALIESIEEDKDEK